MSATSAEVIAAIDLGRRLHRRVRDLIRSRCSAGQTAAESWLEAELLRRDPTLDPDDVRYIVRDVMRRYTGGRWRGAA